MTQRSAGAYSGGRRSPGARDQRATRAAVVYDQVRRDSAYQDPKEFACHPLLAPGVPLFKVRRRRHVAGGCFGGCGLCEGVAETWAVARCV